MTTHVDFETAKLLKEKGFDMKIRMHYESNGNMFFDNTPCNFNNVDLIISAPTIAEVVMWLYEKHGIWLYVNMKSKEDGTDEAWFIPNTRYIPSKTKNGFEIDPIIYMCRKSPTEAYKEAIKYYLKELIN